jgi:hypothetical protein
VRITKPAACQKLMTGRLKISGKSAFHKVMVIKTNKKIPAIIRGTNKIFFL